MAVICLPQQANATPADPSQKLQNTNVPFFPLTVVFATSLETRSDCLTEISHLVVVKRPVGVKFALDALRSDAHAAVVRIRGASRLKDVALHQTPRAIRVPS